MEKCWRSKTRLFTSLLVIYKKKLNRWGWDDRRRHKEMTLVNHCMELCISFDMTHVNTYFELFTKNSTSRNSKWELNQVSHFQKTQLDKQQKKMLENRNILVNMGTEALVAGKRNSWNIKTKISFALTIYMIYGPSVFYNFISTPVDRYILYTKH